MNTLPTDHFSEEALTVLASAQQEAERFQHTYVGSEHLLLGLTRQGGDAAIILENLGVSLPKVRSAVAFIIGTGAQLPTRLTGPTDRLVQITRLSHHEARFFKSTEVTPLHLLLALLSEGNGIAVGVLESLGVNCFKARARALFYSGGLKMSEEEYTFRDLAYSLATIPTRLVREMDLEPDELMVSFGVVALPALKRVRPNTQSVSPEIIDAWQEFVHSAAMLIQALERSKPDPNHSS